MTTPTPVLDPSERPDRPGRRGRRSRGDGKPGTALFVTSVILLVVALGAAGAALVVRHDTSDLHARAEPVRAQVRDLAASEASAAHRLHLLRERARATNETLAALFAAELAQVDASNHAVDVANQAVDQYNNAKTTDVAAAFAGAGDAALTDLEAKTAAVRSAAEAAQRAIASLRAVTDG
jgi:hypothetical protein